MRNTELAAECRTKLPEARWWRLTPLILVLGSPMALITAIGRWRQEGIWLGRENLSWEETRALCSLMFGGDRCSPRTAPAV